MSDYEPPNESAGGEPPEAPSLIPQSQQALGLAAVTVVDVLLLLIGVLLVMVGTSYGAMRLFTAFGMGAFALPVVVVMQSLAFLGVLWLVVLNRRGLAWQDVGLVAPTRRWLLRAGLLGLGAVPVAMLINAVMVQLLGGAWENPQIEALAPQDAGIADRLVMLVLVTTAVPFVEELLFRGLLFAWLAERWNLKAAYAVSALVFALVHFIAPLFPALFLVGLLLAQVYRRSGSIWCSIVVHGTFNGLMLAMVLIAQSVAPELM